MVSSVFAASMLLMAGAQGAPEACADTASWADKVLAPPYSTMGVKKPAAVQEHWFEVVRQDCERLSMGRSVIGTPLRIGGKTYSHGLGTHSVSEIRVGGREPIRRFSAEIGVDNNDRTRGGRGSVVFSVSAEGKELYRSAVMRGGQEPVKVDVDAGGARVIELHVEDGGDGLNYDHADWADAAVTLDEGKVCWIDEMHEKASPAAPLSRYPFSFTYAGKDSSELLGAWPKKTKSTELDANRTRITTTWTDKASGLRVCWDAIRYSDYPALEWVLYFENAGAGDTDIVENVQAMNLLLDSVGRAGFLLHKTNGDPTDRTAYEVKTTALTSSSVKTMGGMNGQGSRKDFPFFKVESSDRSMIVAVGWSGQWRAVLDCPDDNHLHMTAGLENTHFRLHPGERVRSPRMLLLNWRGDTRESNNQFRGLIYKHYTPKRNGHDPLPALFCNTCYTRLDGGWLNECNAENQISLINAYGKLGLEALVTDAGWFEGGWPNGAGNWTPRKDAYPNGMGPVAAAGKKNGIAYGLWFEPERVVAGTWVHTHHPEWCLSAQPGPQGTYLLNFGLPEVQEYFFNIVKGFMDLPGFRFYRQDHNFAPLSFLRFNDATDRQGITEMKYFEGLYAYWDSLAKVWPDSFREECTGGGGRIDIETIKRFHIHQKSDYNFDYEANQQTLWGMSQYMPNNTFVCPLKTMDDYSFHSNMACSLLLAWIADAPDFDYARAKRLTDRYRQVRHLLIGDWYPLLPSSYDLAKWYAVQFHRPDLKEGMIIACRRPESPDETMMVALHGLNPHATYELCYDSDGHKSQVAGSDLMKGLKLTIPQKRGSDLVQYKLAQ